MRIYVSTDADGIKRVRVYPGKIIKDAASVSVVLTAPDGAQDVYFLDRSPVPGGVYVEDRNARLSKFVRRSGESFVLFMPEGMSGNFHMEFYVKEPAKSVVICSKDFLA